MKRLLLIAVMVTTLALAELIPQKGQYDPLVRVLNFNPMKVVKLSTFYGVLTHIQFAEGGTIKPLATKADTNVTVVSAFVDGINSPYWCNRVGSRIRLLGLTRI